MEKEWTLDSMMKDAEKREVKYVRLMLTDILGMVKTVEVPIYQLEKALKGELAFDGSSIAGFVGIEESDMYLVPDPQTWQVFEWDEGTPGRVASLICNVETADRQAFSGDPRARLEALLNKLPDLGYTAFNLGAEPEFYMFKRDEAGEITTNLNDQGAYFELAPTELQEICRREIALELEKLGFSIEASHHEVGPGQHEINWRFAPGLEACDAIQTFKLVCKTVARRHNLYISFMPKPVNGLAGSGMHFNFSLANEEGNAFYDPDDPRGLSQDAYYFIGGLLKYASAYTAICNPTVNSYKRLVPGHEAPVYIAWAQENRTPLIRIPASRGQATRIELRSVDPSANPYLALIVILAAGLKGIEDRIDPGEPVSENLFAFSPQEVLDMGISELPETLYEALLAFSQEDLMKQALGDHIHQNFIKIKSEEWNRYKIYVSAWEMDEYFDRY